MLLQMKHITKIYNNTVVANDDVSFDLSEGEILAIVGENGAGKSTVMKILYGLERATEGEIYLRGELQNFKNPQDAMKQGIGMVQQNFMLFSPFTVAENIVYGNEPKNRGIFFDRKRAVTIVEELSEKYALYIDPNAKIEDCPVGLQQRAEILKILYQDAEIIIFDEPTAVLTPQEVDELLKTIKNLAGLGKSIILITHKLQEVMDVADNIVVMRQGKKVAEKKKEETTIEELSYLMVGRQLCEMNVSQAKPGANVLDVKDLHYITADGKNVLNGVNLHVEAGEIVGIAGVSGNGQTELVDCITGELHATEGSVSLNGKEITSDSVRQIRDASLALIPEDRFLTGCAKDADLTESTMMVHYRKDEYSHKGILKNKEIRKFVKNLLDGYGVYYSGLAQKTGQLSGGNAQKLIVAREIELKTKLLIAAEPTRGVDVGAMEFIHEQLVRKRDGGDAVLLISCELSEILCLADRIYVMYGGETVGELTRQEATSEKLGLMMLGGKVK